MEYYYCNGHTQNKPYLVNYNFIGNSEVTTTVEVSYPDTLGSRGVRISEMSKYLNPIGHILMKRCGMAILYSLCICY